MLKPKRFTIMRVGGMDVELSSGHLSTMFVTVEAFRSRWQSMDREFLSRSYSLNRATDTRSVHIPISNAKSLGRLARPERFERPTLRFVGLRSE